MNSATVDRRCAVKLSCLSRAGTDVRNVHAACLVGSDGPIGSGSGSGSQRCLERLPARSVPRSMHECQKGRSRCAELACL